MKRESVKRVLPADVYDALELSALAWGGIGAGRFVEKGVGIGRCPLDVPLCAHGHAYSCDPGRFSWESRMSPEILSAGIGAEENDQAVRRINRRRGRPETSRVTFHEWCKELNVIRAASEVVPK